MSREAAFFATGYFDLNSHFSIGLDATITSLVNCCTAEDVYRPRIPSMYKVSRATQENGLQNSSL
jgi:hypothetical protein